MIPSPPPPTPQAQVRFLERIQRILAEGRFTATYKFALLHALADLAVTHGGDVGGGSLAISIDDLTRRFVALYARQSRPYPAPTGPVVLKQNKQRQAAVVRVLAERVGDLSGGRADNPVAVDRYLPRADFRTIHETIRDQPLWKLQRVSDAERLDFLYRNSDEYAIQEIVLQPGAAYCLRAFHGLITAMVRLKWEAWVRQRNSGVLGEPEPLAAFLFGSDRNQLGAYRKVLEGIAGRRCFYTRSRITRSVVVDHFIPWARYPMDFGHNFVLTTSSTNSSKADHLADERHLERWLAQCIRHESRLTAEFERRELPHNLSTNLTVAQWAYGQADHNDARVWSARDRFTKLTGAWRSLIADARKELAPDQTPS